MVTRKQVVNYGGDAMALIAGAMSFVAFASPFVPDEYAGLLALVALLLTRGSTVLANLIDYLKSDEAESLDGYVFVKTEDVNIANTADTELPEAKVIADEPVIEEEGV